MKVKYMIRLPQYIGIEIREMIDRYRKNNNIPEPDEIKKIYNKNEQFLEEELYYITSLKVNSDIISFLKYFPNLTELIIESEKELKQDEIASIINMYPNLKSLSICEQNNLHFLDVSSLSNLETLKIVSNRSLTGISGIDELKKIYFLDIYDNPSLDDISIETLVEKTYKIINEFKSNYCNIDVLYMPEFMNYLNRNGISIDSVKDYLKWSEHSKSGIEMGKEAYITHTTGELYNAYRKALDIVNKYIKSTDTQKQKYAILYEWMCENVTYDHSARNNRLRIHSSNGLAQGRPYGTNGSINAFIEGSCVCQGYTKTMQLLLKLNFIHTYDVLCRAGESINKNKMLMFEDGIRHSDDTDHSILRVSLDGKNFYSDVTWDAASYQRNSERKYFLLSKEDISKDHKLVGQDKVEDADESINEQEFEKLINFAKARIESVDKKMDDEKNKAERLKQLKEEYDKIEKQISSLERYSKEHTVINYQTKLNNLTKQRDDILKLMNELMVQLKKKDSTKVQSHDDVINQVERLLGISIKQNGNKTTLLQDKIRVYKQLEQLYNDGKIDIRSYTQMRNEVIKEYDAMIAAAPNEINEQGRVQFNIHESQRESFNSNVERIRMQFEQNRFESEHSVEDHRRIM